MKKQEYIYKVVSKYCEDNVFVMANKNLEDCLNKNNNLLLANVIDLEDQFVVVFDK